MPARPDITASSRIVVLHGKDAFMIGERSRQLIDALRAEHGEIEQFAYDGATAQAVVILDELRSFGLMQRHKLVIVDNADQLLKAGGDDDDESESDAGGKPARALMERYAANPLEEATLLLRAPTWRPGNFDKAVNKVGAVIKCEPPSEADAISWCRQRSAAHGCQIAADAASDLVGRIGPDRARLDGELAKLAAMIDPGATIGRDHVRQMVGLSREEKAWEVQSPLLEADAGGTLAKLADLMDVSRADGVLITWSILDALRKLHDASRLVRQGAPPAAVASTLKLWGPARDQIIERATRNDPSTLARLLRTAIECDVRRKTGLATDDRRALEMLAVTITRSLT